jgi:thiamine-monophosphate kinase
MLINKIGEFALIKRIKKFIKGDASVIKGPGDDCAVVKYDRAHYLLLSCDMLVEDVDFTKKADAYLIGRKALAVSLSDIAACGGIPRYALVSLGLPKRSSLELVDGITRGIRAIARQYKVNIVGGDLSRAGKIIIDVSITGLVKKRHLLLRSGAKVGDVIFVSGALGGSISGKHLRFTPRLKESQYLVRNFKVSSMIDISDGLAQDLYHICTSSGVGAMLCQHLIPLNKAARGLEDALYSGEDFELLFTLPPPEAKRLLKKAGRFFYPIGEVVAKRCGVCLVDQDHGLRLLPSKGFRHF